MVDLKFSHPLQWPQGYPHTEVWSKSVNNQFKMGMTIQEALMFLYEELQQLNASKAVLYSNYENIEKPSAIRRIGNDSGVTLQFYLNNNSYRIACDRWVPVEQNIYALHLALRNLRMVVEWGVGSLEDVFGGYSVAGAAAAGMAANGNGLEEWRKTLGLGPTATLDDAQAVYRRRAKSLADKPEELMKLNLAMDEASKALSL